MSLVISYYVYLCHENFRSHVDNNYSFPRIIPLSKNFNKGANFWIFIFFIREYLIPYLFKNILFLLFLLIFLTIF